MSDTNHTETDAEETVVISTRLPRELVEFLDSAKEDLCNSRVGVIRLAVTQFRKSYEAAAVAAKSRAA